MTISAGFLVSSRQLSDKRVVWKAGNLQELLLCNFKMPERFQPDYVAHGVLYEREARQAALLTIILRDTGIDRDYALLMAIVKGKRGIEERLGDSGVGEDEAEFLRRVQAEMEKGFHEVRGASADRLSELYDQDKLPEQKRSELARTLFAVYEEGELSESDQLNFYLCILTLSPDLKEAVDEATAQKYPGNGNVWFLASLDE